MVGFAYPTANAKKISCLLVDSGGKQLNAIFDSRSKPLSGVC